MGLLRKQIMILGALSPQPNPSYTAYLPSSPDKQRNPFPERSKILENMILKVYRCVESYSMRRNVQVN